MASKFQNRLVGAIVLVAAGVIVLPALLDGDKKYNEDQFASIPIIPQPGDEQDIEALAPIIQTATPSIPSEGASEAMISEAITEQAKSDAENQPIKPAETSPALTPQVKPKPEPKPEPKPVTKPVQETAKPEVTAPQGKAYIVQLGALKNALKVEEIVVKLRLSGYQVYTVPSSPANGQLTRIFVGPDASRQKLENALAELKSISGLEGQIRPYKP